jgi:hypothetical protein
MISEIYSAKRVDFIFRICNFHPLAILFCGVKEIYLMRRSKMILTTS